MLTRKEKFDFCYQQNFGVWGNFDITKAIEFIDNLAKVPDDLKTKEFVQLEKAYAAFLNSVFEYRATEHVCPSIGQIVKHVGGYIALQNGTIWSTLDTGTWPQGGKEIKNILMSAHPTVKVKPWKPKNKKVIKQLEELLEKAEYKTPRKVMETAKEARRIKRQKYNKPTTMQTYKEVWPIYYQLKDMKMPEDKSWIESWRKYRELLNKRTECWNNDQRTSADMYEKLKGEFAKIINSLEMSQDATNYWGNRYAESKCELAVIIPGMEKLFKEGMDQLVPSIKEHWRNISATEILRNVVDKKSCQDNHYSRHFYGYADEEKEIIQKENREREKLIKNLRSMIISFQRDDLIDYLNGKPVTIDPMALKVLKDLNVYKDKEIQVQKEEEAAVS